MKHTTSYYQTAERWVKNAAHTARKHMTYDNAMKALMVASLLPVVSSAAGAVRAGLAAGSAAQVAGGVATGSTAVGSAIPSLAPAAQTARTYQVWPQLFPVAWRPSKPREEPRVL